jgi:hypothetical protein
MPPPRTRPFLLDLSALIAIRRRGRLRPFGQLIRRGEAKVAKYALNRLAKASSWRKWVESHRALVEIPVALPEEMLLFAVIRQRYGVGSRTGGQRQLSDDDIDGIVIAKVRRMPMVIRDAAAEQVAREYVVTLVTIEDYLTAQLGSLS